MCSLFGLIDYGNCFTGKQKTKIISILSAACEVRGTDATGFACNERGRLVIFKRPLPAHRVKFRVSSDTQVVMGHTRMATQGAAKINRNNHPFPGQCGALSFALAHNGVLYNDIHLRREKKLPPTKIETDSYIAVQLLEQQKTLDFSGLQSMAEKVEGTFVFTVLDERDNLYFVKGDNPLCLYHFQSQGFYIYASTEEILRPVLQKLRLDRLPHTQVPLISGDILKIAPDGSQSREVFDDRHLYRRWHYSAPAKPAEEDFYLRQFRTAASSFGYPPEAVDELLLEGFTFDEIEEMLYEEEAMWQPVARV